MIKIYSIFQSISGEAGKMPQGTPCNFVRLQGCNLRCAYCDTKDAQQEQLGCGEMMSASEIAQRLQSTWTKKVLITGGEPLFQYDGTTELIKILRSHEYLVQVETNGSFPLPETLQCTPGVHWVMDFKLPESGQTEHMLSLDNITQLSKVHHIDLKLVVANTLRDANYAIAVMRELQRCEFTGNFIVSPLNAEPHGVATLYNLINENAPWLLNKIIFSLQLHKICKLP